MAVLHSLLAVYAAFDRSVVEADNREWSRLVESFLPGTTGENQRGWSNDVEELVRQLAPDPQEDGFPDLRGALEELSNVAIEITSVAYGGQAAQADRPPLVSVTHISQLLYAVAVGRKLAGRAPPTSIDFSLFTDGGDLQGLSPILGLAGDPLENIFRTLGSTQQMPESAQQMPESAPPTSESTPPTSESTPQRFQSRQQTPPGSQGFDTLPIDPTRDKRINDLKALLDGNQFIDRKSWPHVMTLALQTPLVSQLVASATPLTFVGTAQSAQTPDGAATAAAAVTEIDGNFCAVLTTDCWRKAPGLTVQKVKGIVDPLNWEYLNPFFCEMDRMLPDIRRASQVLEHVSTDKDMYQLKTALKYWKSDFDGGAIVNYELADNRTGTGDSLLTLEDSGYIHIIDDGQDRVRIRTSKMVAIEGGSVTATAIFILAIGWAAMGDSMFFDNVLKPPVGVPFTAWSTNPEALSGPAAAAAQAAAAAAAAGPAAPQIPAGGLLVRECARGWADYVKDTTKSTQAVVDKWYSGKLTIQDMMTYTAELGGRLASEPWRFLAELSKQVPTPPPPPPSATPNTNGGGSP
jgi:hypothetical protein